MTMPKLYDEKCLDLARTFLADSDAISIAQLSDLLAQEIQTVIEDFFKEHGIN